MRHNNYSQIYDNIAGRQLLVDQMMMQAEDIHEDDLETCAELLAAEKEAFETFYKIKYREPGTIKGLAWAHICAAEICTGLECHDVATRAALTAELGQLRADFYAKYKAGVHPQ